MLLSDERSKRARDYKELKVYAGISQKRADSEARAIQREVEYQARRAAFLIEFPEKEDEHDRMLRYLEREKLRRWRYIQTHTGRGLIQE